jgi:hypothetical protein
MDKPCLDPSSLDLLSLDPFSVEDGSASGTKGIVPDAGQEQTDPDWQPL